MRKLASIFLCLVVFLCACRDGGRASPPPLGVTITPSAAMVDVGTTQTFTAAVLNDPQGRDVTWTQPITSRAFHTAGKRGPFY